MSEYENCHVEPLRKPLVRKALTSAEVAFLTVAGMGCPNCAILLRRDGVLSVDVSLARGMAAVALRTEQISAGDLITAAAGAGDETDHHYLARLLQTMPAREAFTFAA